MEKDKNSNSAKLFQDFLKKGDKRAHDFSKYYSIRSLSFKFQKNLQHKTTQSKGGSNKRKDKMQKKKQLLFVPVKLGGIFCFRVTIKFFVFQAKSGTRCNHRNESSDISF